MKPVPFKLINAAEWARVRATSEQVITDWAAHWLPDEAPDQVECAAAFAPVAERCTQADSVEAPSWHCYTADGLPMIHIEAPALLRATFSEAVFGAVVKRFDASGTGPSQLLDGVLHAAMADLAARFAAAAGIAGADALTLSERAAAPGAHQTRRGAGAVRVRRRLGKVCVLVILTGALVRPLLAMMPRVRAPARALTPLTPTLISRPLTLRAWAGDVEISLGEIRHLTPGDVVSIDARVDQPFRLTLDGATVAPRGYLGSSQGHKALRLVPPQFSPETKT